MESRKLPQYPHGKVSHDTNLAPSRPTTLLEPVEQVLTTLNRDGTRRWLRPRVSRGRFLTARRGVAYSLIAIFTTLPYLTINGKPAILLDIPAREFTFFGATLLATDTVLLALFMVGLITSIFLATALFGRVWCGWACPQTVYMEFFYRPIERLFEGAPGRDGKPGSRKSGPRTAFKYLVFFLLSMLLAHTFLAYFVGIDKLVHWVRQSPLAHPVPFVVMIGVTALMMFDFAFFREQTCLIACPYGRFQSVLLDRDSLIISYDENRGEPRGKRRASPESGAQHGDCVDCTLCVQTCPTGIDIRKGLQMECIGCAQCIDACDAVMDKIKRPRGLIRYSSQRSMEEQQSRVLRPRLFFYPAILVTIATAFLFVLSNKQHLDVTVLRGVGMPYVRTDSGEISNQIRIKLVNRADRPIHCDIEFAAATPGTIVIDDAPIQLNARETTIVHARIIMPPEFFTNRSVDLPLRIVDDLGYDRPHNARLLGPTFDSSAQ
ncbi:MAG: cytochrome c oxidase accessory protein CcoG, partial [Thermomicrobiales bacterium]